VEFFLGDGVGPRPSGRRLCAGRAIRGTHAADRSSPCAAAPRPRRDAPSAPPPPRDGPRRRRRRAARMPVWLGRDALAESGARGDERFEMAARAQGRRVLRALGRARVPRVRRREARGRPVGHAVLRGPGPGRVFARGAREAEPKVPRRRRGRGRRPRAPRAASRVRGPLPRARRAPRVAGAPGGDGREPPGREAARAERDLRARGEPHGRGPRRAARAPGLRGARRGRIFKFAST